MQQGFVFRADGTCHRAWSYAKWSPADIDLHPDDATLVLVDEALPLETMRGLMKDLQARTLVELFSLAPNAEVIAIPVRSVPDADEWDSYQPGFRRICRRPTEEAAQQRAKTRADENEKRRRRGEPPLPEVDPETVRRQPGPDPQTEAEHRAAIRFPHHQVLHSLGEKP